MSIFSYKAKNLNGELVEGMVDAASEDIVAILLMEKGLSVIELKKRGLEEWENVFYRTINHITSKEKVIFFRQLAVMVDANLPIIKVLRILVKQTSNKYLKTIIADIGDEVDGGSKLSQAMAKFPNVFSDFYINIIASGETSGRLAEVVTYLADQQEKDYELQSKVRGAMIYPIFILFGLVAVGMIVMVFVVPQMTSMLKESGIELPLITKMFLAVAEFLTHYTIILATVVSMLILGFLYVIRKTISGRRYFDIFKIKIPVFGKIAVNMYIVRITRSLSTLLRGGVPAARALRVVKNVVGNKVYEEILEKTIEQVDEGSSIADSLIGSDNMPILVSQMISVGEETGKLYEVLEKLTKFYSNEIDVTVANLSVLIEPIIMVFLAVLVGGFVAAVIMPMWQLSGAF